MSLSTASYIYIYMQNLNEISQVIFSILYEQAISACEWALCQLTVCLEFQSKSEGRKGHKNCTLHMTLQSKVPCLIKM